MLKIKEVRKSKNITQNQIVEMTGIKKRTYLSYENEETDIPLYKLQKIATSLKVDISDLINDVLNVKEAGVKEKTEVYKLRTDKNLDSQTIPLYNVEATCGIEELFNSNNSVAIDLIRIPNAPKCDGAIYATGDSMYPLIKSGDMIAYKQVHDLKNGIFGGEMYVIGLNIDGDEIITIKYMQESDKGDNYYRLVSLNKHHQDKDVHIKNITAVALVKMAIRNFTMN